MLAPFMGASTDKTTWLMVSTSLKATVAQVTALWADRIHPNFPIVLSLESGPSKVYSID